MSSAQALRFVRRRSCGIGHLVLELGETECAATTWALRTDHGNTAVASGFVDAEGDLARDLAAASALIREFTASAVEKEESPCH